MKYIKYKKIVVLVIIAFTAYSMSLQQEIKLEGIFKETKRNVCYQFKNSHKCIIDGVNFKYTIEDSVVSLYYTFSNAKEIGPSKLKIIDYSIDNITFVTLNHSDLYLPNDTITINRVSVCDW